jgi:hypothetical protein
MQRKTATYCILPGQDKCRSVQNFMSKKCSFSLSSNLGTLLFFKYFHDKLQYLHLLRLPFFVLFSSKKYRYKNSIHTNVLLCPFVSSQISIFPSSHSNFPLQTHARHIIYTLNSRQNAFTEQRPWRLRTRPYSKSSCS